MMLTSLNSGVPLSLKGRVALVTGGSRGIGAATVRIFHRAGAHVIFSYRAAHAQAAELVRECGGEDYCRAIQRDLTTIEDGQALIHAAAAAFGRIDCLIINHGIWPPHDAPIDQMTADQWRETLSINLDSVFGLLQAGVAQLKLQSPLGSTKGHIVLVSSTAGQRGAPFHVDYAASKGALISLTKSLSTELAADGIYCNCVAPGWVVTEMSAAALEHPEKSKKLLAAIPLGRAAHVDEIAGPILFLCTPLAGFISGEIFNVNGGAVLIG